MENQTDVTLRERVEPDADSQTLFETRQPLLYRKREYASLPDGAASTTSCQVTSNPNDYGPDD